MTTPNYRKEAITSLLPYFDRDPRYFLLLGDMGFGAIDSLRDKHPDRVINCGIMEPGMVGIAAGMAMNGMIPIVYSIVNFLAFRALEQIRNDVVLQGLNVKFIGTGANDYFRFLGHSHCCGQDDVRLFNVIHLPVYDPYTATEEFDPLITRFMTGENAGYLRV